MDTNALIEALDAEIVRLEQVKALLNGAPVPVKRSGRTTAAPKTGRGTMSPEGKARVAAAQRARRAKAKGKK